MSAVHSIPPKGTRHRQKQMGSTRSQSANLPPARRSLTPKDIEDLAHKIKEQFGWENGPQDFQMAAIRAQLEGQDTLVHAKTGAGKTGVVAGPHLHPSSKGRVSIMVSPLLALHDEMVSLETIYVVVKQSHTCYRWKPSKMSSN